MPKSHYTRQGVEASARLVSIEDPSIWGRIEEQYASMISEKGGDTLSGLDNWCENLGKKLRETEEDRCISSDDLTEIVQWKFAKGKSRPGLWKHLRANTPSDVKRHSSSSFVKADKGDVRGAIEDMSNLKGVGPATASAVLSFYKPEVFLFMDDEVIECLNNAPRKYTLTIYLILNDKCVEIANKLGEDWTPRRVGRAIWTAARVEATGGEDLTAQSSSQVSDSQLGKRISSTSKLANSCAASCESKTRKKRRVGRKK